MWAEGLAELHIIREQLQQGQGLSGALLKALVSIEHLRLVLLAPPGTGCLLHEDTSQLACQV